MCSNKTIEVYAGNKLNKNNLVLFQSSEKHKADRMRGAARIENLSLKYHNIHDKRTYFKLINWSSGSLFIRKLPRSFLLNVP